jgi:C4-dicarboxylate transporter DctM subunit
MIVMCVTGLPIAFGMIISTTIVLIIFKPIGFLLIAQKMMVGMDSFILLAIPFFTFTGLIMTEGGVTKRLMRFARTIVGHWPGGLGHVNVVASMLFSGISGTGTADAAGLGRIEAPLMLDSGYPRPFTGAITAASSTIGPIVPPSVPMVVFGALCGVSVGRLFLGGILPGVLMGIGLIIYILIVAKRYNFPLEKKASFREVLASFKDSALALLLPIMVVGGIVGGIFTPTEAAAVAAVYAIIVTMVVYRELSISDLGPVLLATAKVSGTIMFVVGAASVFGHLLLIGGFGDQLMALFDIMGGSTRVHLLTMIIIILILGCFIESCALIIMMGPILLPVILKLGVDPVHFGVMMVLAVMLGLITPPVGLVAYIICDIVGVSLGTFTKAILPFFIVLVVVLLVIAYVPSITLYIPNLIMGH